MVHLMEYVLNTLRSIKQDWSEMYQCAKKHLECWKGQRNINLILHDI